MAFSYVSDRRTARQREASPLETTLLRKTSPGELTATAIPSALRPEQFRGGQNAPYRVIRPAPFEGGFCDERQARHPATRSDINATVAAVPRQVRPPLPIASASGLW